jgi:hypothetical protein
MDKTIKALVYCGVAALISIGIDFIPVLSKLSNLILFLAGFGIILFMGEE